MSQTIYTPQQMMKKYMEMAAEILPNPHYDKIIPDEEIEKEISLLKETLDGERFFFVINLHSMSLEHVHGIEKWLGYKDHQFSLPDYLSIIHPSHAAVHRITSVHGIEGLMRGNWQIEFMKHRYITNIALRHKDGHYLLCKRLASVFQYFIEDGKHRLLEYINEFTVVGDYNEEPYITRTGAQSEIERNWETETLSMIKKAFEDKYLFTVQELRILRKYAYDQSLQVADVAKSFKIENSTVITHHKRILEKAEKVFDKKFNNAKEVSLYLKRQKLI